MLQFITLYSMFRKTVLIDHLNDWQKGVIASFYGCSRLSLNAGSLIQFCQVPILLRPLFIPLKSLVRDDTQQVRYNGKSTELVSQLARIALLQQTISDMWRCTFYKISILLVLRYMYLYKKQHIGDMLWCTSYKRIGSSKFNRKVCMYHVDIR